MTNVVGDVSSDTSNNPYQTMLTILYNVGKKMSRRKRLMKEAIFREKVKNVCLCVRSDARFRPPIIAAQGYRDGAKKSLKIAKAADLKKKQRKRLIKDIKRDIKVAERVIYELAFCDDINEVLTKLCPPIESYREKL